jgi:hypothetical protein
MRMRYGIGFKALKVPRSSAGQRRRGEASTAEARRDGAPRRFGSRRERKHDAPSPAKLRRRAISAAPRR